LEKTTYWKRDEAGNQTYYYDYKEIGDQLAMVKFIMNSNKVSSSNAHKTVRKIKEFKVSKK
jgi:hypothetical protein